MRKEFELLKSAGIFNQNLTLDQIIKAGEQIRAVNYEGKVAWELINKDFVFQDRILNKNENKLDVLKINININSLP